MSSESADPPIENLGSILISLRLMGFPLAMRSFRHFPPLPSAVMGVLAGVEMEEACLASTFLA